MPESSAPRVAGGRLLGGFSYASTGTVGWGVVHKVDAGGLGDDAVAEGTRLIERLPWWPDEPLTAGANPYERPRRLAWLRGRSSQRRYLLHTIHAENDASARPDNNFTECWVVEPPDAPQHVLRPGPVTGPDPGDGPTFEHLQGVRPSRLWDPDGWLTPWGATEVAQARLGSGGPAFDAPTDDVLDVILSEPSGALRLRVLLAAVHAALHVPGRFRPVVGQVDNLIWGAGLLDSVIVLLPRRAAWDVSFDLRTSPPPVLGAAVASPGVPALVSLFGLGHRDRPPADALDLSASADADRLADGLPRQRHDCPECEQWYPSVDALLDTSGVDVTGLRRQVELLREGESRRVPRAGAPWPPAVGVDVPIPPAPRLHGASETYPAEAGVVREPVRPEAARPEAVQRGLPSDPAASDPAASDPAASGPAGSGPAGSGPAGSAPVRPHGPALPAASSMLSPPGIRDASAMPPATAPAPVAAAPVGPDLSELDGIIAALQQRRSWVAGTADPAAAQARLLQVWQQVRTFAGRQIESLEASSGPEARARADDAPDRQSARSAPRPSTASAEGGRHTEGWQSW